VSRLIEFWRPKHTAIAVGLVVACGVCFALVRAVRLRNEDPITDPQETPNLAAVGAATSPGTPGADLVFSGQTVRKIPVERGEISVPGIGILDGSDPDADPPQTAMNIRIWDSPLDRQAICQLGHGTQVGVLDATWVAVDDEYYFLITENGCEGWVAAHLIDVDYQAPIGEQVDLDGDSPPSSSSPTPPPALVAEDGGVNVRGGPGLDYAVVGSLMPGDTAAVTGRHQDWLRIDYGGGDAWVAGWVVAAQGVDDVPQVDAASLPPTPAPTPTTSATPQPTEDPACTPDADFEDDVTVGDNTRIEAGERFVKTWRVLNTGSCSWGPDYHVGFMAGEQMGGPAELSVPMTRPGESLEISMELVAPSTPGAYRGDWRMVSDVWGPFGSLLYVQILVYDPGAP
jgi:hypothetical protein